MEIRDFALRVLGARDLDRKLAPPGGPLEDGSPGPAFRAEGPGRPADLAFGPAGAIKVPKPGAFGELPHRRRILHALANHELQAAELYAWALLAFPETPADFRRGLLRVLLDEQRHTRMYRARLEACGGRFGEHPVNGYFWGKIERIHTPLEFVCAMALTFENANLDHTVDLAAAARAAGDEKTALAIERVHRDEIRHVRFGWEWLGRFKRPEESMWEAFRAALTWPLRPAKARGKAFYAEPRLAAGLEPEFVRLLETSEA